MPDMPRKKKVGTRHDASDDGNNWRIATTYDGMMPEKPRPNAADTANTPISFWVSRNPATATAWQADPTMTARSPPTRSASIPQNCRLMNAQASSTESIAAPCVGTMPRSVQNATRWPFGTAIGMQQKNAAMQISARARLAFNP